MKKFKLPGTNLTLIGKSRSSDATGFSIPELKIHLDAGLISSLKYHYEVFITHTHSDHAHMLPYFATRHIPREVSPTNIYVPQEALRFVRNFMKASEEMNDNRFYESSDILEKTYQFHGVFPGDLIKMQRGNTTYVVKVIECFHIVPCVGYLFYQRKSLLKAEFQELKGIEIAELKKSGVKITHEVEIPLFAYLGDSTVQVFDDRLLVEIPIIIAECSFLDDEDFYSLKGEKTTLHIYWSDLEPIILENKDCLFILIHFSLKYLKKEIANFFKKHNFDNVLVWI